MQSQTDELGRTTSYAYDDADRVIETMLPGGRVVAFGYDANDNVTSVTPPTRPAHEMAYTAGNQLASYEPPPLMSVPAPTQYTYNLDRQIVDVTLPSGAVIHHGYDAGGRLATVTTPRGTFTTSYDPVTHQIASTETPEGVVTSFVHDGSRLASVGWTGPVSGSVAWTHDANGRVTSQQVSGTDPVAFAYDGDGLLTQAGPLTITRDLLNGQTTGSSVGEVHHTVSHDTFGAISHEEYAIGSDARSVLRSAGLSAIQDRCLCRQNS